MSRSILGPQARALLALFFLTACDQPHTDTSTPPAVTVTRAKMGYALTYPATWHTFTPEVFGQHTDLALLQDGRYFTVVVEPDAGASLQAFVATSLSVFETTMTQFELLRKVDIVLDGQPAVTIFATGEMKNLLVHYSITYMVKPPWRYQTVAWTAPSRASQLALDVDGLLAGWRFLP